MVNISRTSIPIADCALTITLTDRNDVRPKFYSMNDTVVIVKSALHAFITNLHAFDEDSVGTLNYSVLENRTEFEIRNNTELWKLSALEGSSVAVGVSDSLHLERMTINVIIEEPSEENLNKLFNKNMVEEQPSGTNVFWVNDTEYENYRFIENTATTYFTLNNNTGEVVTAKKIDRDEDKFLIDNNYILDFRIRVNKKGFPCSFVILGRLNVTIEDVNDNPPVFDSNTYSGSVKENVVNGTPVTLYSVLRVTDKDTKGHLTYSSSLPVFSVTENGGILEIVTLGNMDREVTPAYTLVISVSDGVHVVHENVTITVEDTNDHMPVYRNSTTSFSVSEDIPVLTNISTLWFTDADTGQNSKLTYHVDSGYFDADDGVLKVDVALDRETIERHHVVLTVCDQGRQPRCTTKSLTINVTDANDNPPVYMTYDGTLRINESVPCGPATPFARVNFTDVDIGRNSELEYSITGNKTDFHINVTTGELYCVNGLDYDNTIVHRTPIQIHACDKGTSPKCSENITLYVDVADVNDNTPNFIGDFKDKLVDIKIDKDDFSVSVPVKLVSVIDRDSGDNAKLVFSIDSNASNGSRFLRINTNNGLISTQAVDGIEADKNYSLVVIVTDKGDVPLSSTATIIFSAIIRDKSFKFRVSTLSKSVSEGSPVSTNIVTMSAYLEKTGSDPNVQIDYDIPGESDLVYPFSINSSNGIISVTKTLDRETTNEYIFVVRATAAGANALVLVALDILDVNDHRPVLGRDRTSFTHQEDALRDAVIGSVSATDMDEGDNAITEYSIKSLTIDDYCARSYGINTTTGDIYLTTEVDFDVIHQANQNTYCYLTIVAVDKNKKEFNDSLTITMEVTDINDNAPEFVGTYDSIEVREDITRTDQIVLPFVVTDNDRQNSANSHVIISIHGIDCPFDIKSKGNNQSLILTLQKSVLDYENKTSLSCNLTARDHGEPVLSSYTVFNISVTDVNDNAPVVLHEPYILNISRYTKTNTVILKEINATDRDSGVNGDVRFYKGEDVLTANPWMYFQLAVSTGEMTVIKQLRNLPMDNVTLSVNVSDQGSPPLTTMTEVLIMIQDDNVRPYFNITEIHLSIREGRVSTNTDLLDKPIIAYDEDSETGACDCTYSLKETPYSGNFSIDNSTARIILLEGVTLDREDISVITLHVIGEDKGSPPKITQDHLVVYLTLEDVNDNPPTFNQSSYYINKFQEYPVNTPFPESVTVLDRDEIVSIYVFSITNFTTSPEVSQNFTESVITIDQSGKLSLNHSVDLGLLNDFFLTVTIRVEDRDRPTFYDTTFVRINVSYNNPNKWTPRFVDEPYRPSLDTSAVKPGTINNRVFDVKAEDNDTGSDGKFTFSILSGNIRDIFYIGPSNGTITLQHPIDDTVYNPGDPKRIHLTVMVVDQGVVPKSSTTVVIITPVGSPQQCDFGSLVNNNNDALTAEEMRYFIAMFALIGVTCLLLVSNSIFIILYCRKSLKRETINSGPSPNKAKRYHPKLFKGGEYEDGTSAFRFNQWSEPDPKYRDLSNFQRPPGRIDDDVLDFSNNDNLVMFQRPDLPLRNNDHPPPLPLQEPRDSTGRRDTRPTQLTHRESDRPDDMYVTPLPEPTADYSSDEEERLDFVGHSRRTPSDYITPYPYKSSFS